METALTGFAMSVDACDPETRRHGERLARYATRFGAHIGLPRADLDVLVRGALLHDVGKVAIPEGVLFKPGPLTDDEFQVVKTHAVVGETLCRLVPSLDLLGPIVRHHHERLDGTGYPDGLHGDQIPLLAQIVGLVDIFDALTSTRPYRTALPAERAWEELTREARMGHRRRDLVEAFIDLSSRGEFAEVKASA